MGELWATLGYDEIAADVARGLRNSPDIQVLQGPPGVGKSFLTRGIGGLWEAGGGATLVVEGDSAKAEVPYYAFSYAMGGLPNGWRDLVPVATAAVRAADLLLGASGLITTTLELLTTAREQHEPARAALLTPPEQVILHDLERLAAERPILLIADNLHWWDAESLDLLKRLLRRDLQRAHPFLLELRVLGVQTPEPFQSVAHPEPHRALLVKGRATYTTLSPIDRGDFQAVLKALGARHDLAPQTVDLIFALTGAHLAIADRAVIELGAGTDLASWDSRDAASFVRQLMTERIFSLGAAGDEASQLLQVAAVLGLVFRRVEIQCATQASETETRRLLRICRDAVLLDVIDEQARFVHDSFRQFFLAEAGPEVVAIHERLDSCLQRLRPGEYELRALNALAGEQREKACVVAVHATLARQREGRPAWDAPPAVSTALAGTPLADAVAKLQDAWQAVTAHQLDYSLRILDRLPRGLPRSVCAEADYIRASCLLATRSEEDRGRARVILQEWEGLEADEPEISIRLRRLLIYGLSHLPDKTEAIRLESRLQHELAERAPFDSGALDALYSLDRTSASVVTSDLALVRIEEAVRHFGTLSDRSELRRPLESYRTLVNFGASLVTNAQYQRAVAVHDEITALQTHYTVGTFPRPDFPALNGLLADYRAGLISAADAVARHRATVAPLLNDHDPFYGGNSHAVFLALSGAPEEGLEILEQLQTLLARRRDPEPSMQYLLAANRCSIEFCLGQPVVDRWQDLTTTVRQIRYTNRPFLERRHERLATLFTEGRPMTGAELDVAVVRRWPHEFGPLWDNFGRGFRMPEVELWREA